MSIYLKYGSIKGSVSTKGYEDQIEVTSAQWGVGRAIASPTGGEAHREASVASISEISCTKNFDKSSNSLLMEALMGKGSEATITFTRTGQGQEINFLTIKLTDALISGYSVSSGGDRPVESFSINFTKLLSEAEFADAKNEKVVTDKVGWNLATSAKA